MNQFKGPPTLDDVLDTYLDAVEEPTLASARDWGRRFPEYADALRSLAVNWKLADRIPEEPEANEIDEDAFVKRGMSIATGLLEAEKKKDLAAANQALAEAKRPIESLFMAAKAVGLTTDSLASNIGISAALVTKLHRRLLKPTSLPQQLVEAIALVIRESVDSVALYLAQPPASAAGALYRAQTKPKVATQEDFFAAVRSDASLNEEARAHWLSLESKRKFSP